MAKDGGNGPEEPTASYGALVEKKERIAPLDEKITAYQKSTKNMYVFSGQKHASVSNVERGRRMDKNFSPGFKNY